MLDPWIPTIIGLVLGYLVNYLADVLPGSRRLSAPACRQCNQAYPVLDYFLGQRCRQCGHGRPVRFWAVLLVLLLASLYIWIHPPPRLGFIPGAILLGYFATVFVIDMEHRLILHPTSLVGALLGLGAGWLSHGILPTILGGIGGFAIMLALYYLGVLFSRLRSRRLRSAGQAPDDEEALGSGDVILAGVLGLMLGWPLIWFSLLVAVLLAGFFGIVLLVFLLVSRRYQTQAWMVFMPYGPFMILSAMLVIYLPARLASVVPM